jgi:uncharacterized DUF497 family protein
MSELNFVFDAKKNVWLIEKRNISFERIIYLIESVCLIRAVKHPNKIKYPNQVIYEIDVDGYVYAVPAVKDGNTIFLKTAFPSRKATKRFRKDHKK